MTKKENNIVGSLLYSESFREYLFNVFYFYFDIWHIYLILGIIT